MMIRDIQRIVFLASLMLLSFQTPTLATTIMGYKTESGHSKEMMTEKIQQIEETDKEFLILFTRRAAFYKLPKEGKNLEKIRNFLFTSKEKKKDIKAEVDLETFRILTLRD